MLEIENSRKRHKLNEACDSRFVLVWLVPLSGNSIVSITPPSERGNSGMLERMLQQGCQNEVEEDSGGGGEAKGGEKKKDL
jgi:hypothetical protein